LKDKRLFQTTVTEQDNEWVAVLIPQRREMKRYFSEIVMVFAPETSLIQPVYDVMGRNEHFVSRFPIVDSSCFGEAELVHGENGKWGLRMKLDRKGIGLWRQATGEYGSQTMVILMDGYFCGTMMIPPYDESGYLMLPPLWSELEARRIASHVPSNYRKANR
ncbi:MAG: hypothetical protein J6W23_01850, partial [Victivallales bacterium]|nr:hypothetical protein [Victivallales bacterium]